MFSSTFRNKKEDQQTHPSRFSPKPQTSSIQGEQRSYQPRNFDRGRFSGNKPQFQHREKQNFGTDFQKFHRKQSQKEHTSETDATTGQSRGHGAWNHGMWSPLPMANIGYEKGSELREREKSVPLFFASFFTQLEKIAVHMPQLKKEEM